MHAYKGFIYKFDENKHGIIDEMEDLNDGIVYKLDSDHVLSLEEFKKIVDNWVKE
jgi:hypothetical protein